MSKENGHESIRWAGLTGLCLAAACGGGVDIDASLALPTDHPSQVSITPALDLSGVEASGWHDRLVIEHIALNLDDVRLLGADPRIPSGGLDLLDRPRVISADGRPGAAVDLAFPRQFVGGEDLAVFLRVARSEILEGASVEVYARLYASAPETHEASRLEAVDPDGEPARGEPSRGEPGRGESERGESARNEDGAVDPDGEPARPADADGAVDPDGEPARESGEGGAVDPDGEPARPADGDETSGAVESEGEPASSSGASGMSGMSEGGSAPADSSGEDGAVDPDGEPAHGTSRAGLVRRADGELPSVAFVLRDDEAADMVATLGSRATLDVVVGIPAARWFSPEVVERVERALLRAAGGVPVEAETTSEASPTRLEGRSGVIEIRRVDNDGVGVGPGSVGRERDGYFLTNEKIERNRLDRDRDR